MTASLSPHFRAKKNYNAARSVAVSCGSLLALKNLANDPSSIGGTMASASQPPTSPTQHLLLFPGVHLPTASLL